MNDRNKALQILGKAREALLDRLAERVVEGRDGILEDAYGESYMGEIEAVYEEIGGRLVKVSEMIGTIPHDDKDGENESVEIRDAGSEEAPTSQDVNFQKFAMQVQQGDIEEAGRSLVELLGVPEDRAGECAAVFRRNLDEMPEFLMMAMKLRAAVMNGAANDAMFLLAKRFGLQGMELADVWEHLKTQAVEA